MPWKAGAGKSEYNRVIVIQDPISQLVRHIPAFWPNTADDNWLAHMAETFARLISTSESWSPRPKPADLESFAAQTALDISKLVSQAGHPCHYIKFDFPQDAQWRFTEPRFPLDKFQHIVQGGFVGQILRPADWQNIEVFNDWTEMARLLGNMIAIGEQLSLQ